MGAAAYATVSSESSGDTSTTSGAEFTITTTPDTMSFDIELTAAGQFTIDWGDGRVGTYTKRDTTRITYPHNYSKAGTYNIGISGQATAYNVVSPIIFSNATQPKIAGISGSLGAIFGTLADGSQPTFSFTFFNSPNLKGIIPADLFKGIYGAPIEGMFTHTFGSCRGLTGNIPENLFGELEGAPAPGMFSGTFSGCRGLTGGIPENLFRGIQGAPAEEMFNSTFSACSGLTSIPENLFKGISGEPAAVMFAGTFMGCAGLTSIPENLFAGIQGTPAPYMFADTFTLCTGLTSVPNNLFSGIDGEPADGMFKYTFCDCGNLTGYVDGGMFPIAAGDVDSPYLDTFAGAEKMDTICPADTYGVTKPNSEWTVAVCSACPDGTSSPAGSTSIDACVVGTVECAPGFAFNYAGDCGALCGNGVTQLRTSTDVVVPLFAAKNTSPAIHIGTVGGVCYADLVAGTVSGEIHVNYNNAVYHTVKY